jgi:hypothetical protein
MALASPVVAASKPHIVVLGKTTTISLRADDADGNRVDVKVRPLLVDGRIKEFTLGNAHEVTERTFAVQRIYRVNDSLPQEAGPVQWRWQEGGWLLVDRTSGKIQQVAMPEFDPETSKANWFRDYAAYCGNSSDGEKLVAIVVQAGQRKALLRKVIGPVKSLSGECPTPVWERDPVRVTFEVAPGQKLTFAIKRRAAGLVTEGENDESEGQD